MFHVPSLLQLGRFAAAPSCHRNVRLSVLSRKRNLLYGLHVSYTLSACSLSL
jgi:hypothetical protein